MKRISYCIVVLAVMFVFAWGARTSHATPISGDIGFGMGATLENAGGSQVTDATLSKQIDFADVVINAGVSLSTGDFLASGILPFVTGATFTDFAFLPGLSPMPVTLWTLTSGGTSASFELTSVLVGSGTSASLLSLTGTGTLALTGFADTPGMWTLSADAAGGAFAFSSTNSVASAPEPGTIALLGIGLAGLVGVGVRRRLKKKED